MDGTYSSSELSELEVICLDRILRGESPILLVTHDRDDDGWQFLDGEHVFEEDGVIVSLAVVVSLDPSLSELADLPVGWYAWRTAPGTPWQRSEGDAPDSLGIGTSPSHPFSKNIEIKARVFDFERLLKIIESEGGAEAEVLVQEDVFYLAPSGRLKLRILGDSSGELIHYHREDSTEPRASHYRIAPTNAPDAMKAILDEVLPVLGTVSKRRRLFRLGQTRVHLDQVDRLGDFVELEVVLQPGQAEAEGVAIAQRLMNVLGITSSHIVKQAYIDLLRAGSSAWPSTMSDPA